MNNKRTTWLAGLLVVQLVIVGIVLLNQGGFRDAMQGPLLAFEAAEVDQILIVEGLADGEGSSLRLSKQDDRWLLPRDLPADQSRVTDLLSKLADLRAPWPVATSASARERFEVAETNRQRHLHLQAAGATVAELYLGTSPGFRRLHVRIPAANEIFDVDLAHFQLPTAVDDWLDRGLLQARGELVALARDDHWRLARSDAGWMLDDGAADSNQAEQMAARLANLRVLGVAVDAEAATPTAAAAERMVATFSVTDSEGRYVLRLEAEPGATEYLITSDRQPGRFRLAGFIAEQLLVDASLLASGPPSASDGAAVSGATEATPAATPAAIPAATPADAAEKVAEGE